MAMLIGAMNYNNNMAYTMVFMVIGIALVGYVVTGINMGSVDIIDPKPKAAFAGGRIHFTLEIRNRSRHVKRALYVVPLRMKKDEFFGPFSVQPRSSQMVEISIPAPKRGRFLLSDVMMVSEFPFSWFQAKWRHSLNMTCLVYPEPLGSRSWPELKAADEGGQEGFHFSGGDDFTGLRPFRPGESQRHVDWKAVARGRPMNVKQFTGGGNVQLWFEWDLLSSLDVEGRLSQLTRWVLQADELGDEFGMKIPGYEMGPDSGTLFTRSCLERLALFGYAS